MPAKSYSHFLLVLAISGCGQTQKVDEGEPDYVKVNQETATEAATTEESASKEVATEESTTESADEQNSEQENPQTEPSHSISLKIAAFNAAILGKTKMGKSDIAGYLGDIITNYDIILIQEVRDISGETPQNLLSIVNSKGKGSYTYTASVQIGRTSSKEQYVYYYRDDKGLNLESKTVFDDVDDVFEREPYIVRFSKDEISFSLIGIHVKPDDAINELNALDGVYNQTQSSADETIILGDLNADCTYLSDAGYAALDLKTDSSFLWSIPKTSDTTTKSTDCAYDNIISRNQYIKSATIFDFKEAYKLDQETTEEVSDHFPVEFTLEIEK